MNTFKLFVTDLDGTLLSSKGELSEENRRAIAELDSLGCLVVPASGRCYKEMPVSVREHPSIHYLIGSNGAVIYDLISGREYHCCISGQIASQTLDILQEYDAYISLHSDGVCYVEGALTNEESFGRYSMPRAYYEIFTDRSVPVDGLWDMARSRGELEMLCAFFTDPLDAGRCAERLEALGGLHVTSSAHGSIEIISADAGKEKALPRLTEMLGIAPEQMIVAGDSGNDVGMLSLTRSSLAMMNAHEGVKAVAGGVACRNDEHIAKYVLDKYFKNGEDGYGDQDHK